MNDITWTYKSFETLDTKELYKILQLRSEVFVVEQNCPYLDADDKDYSAYHLCGWKQEILIAYARILPPGLSYEEASIGRVLTHPAYRKYGAGKILMKTAIEKTFAQYRVNEIKIGAQLYLQQFYTDLGFKQVSPQYLEDDIPHIHMVLTK
jgi:ElaA protein